MDCQELLMFRSGDVLTIANADWFLRVLDFQIKSYQIKFYLVTHNTYYVHFSTSVVTEEIL